VHDPDETDLEILGLLLADARRPYSEIADAVGLSAPAVSDRVSRLRERGIIERFTLDVDRSQLREGLPVLVWLEPAAAGPGPETVRERLLDAGAVEHVFTTAAADLVVVARVPDADVAGWLGGLLDEGAVADLEVVLLSGVDWSPDLGATAFALDCAQCDNTVDSEGTTTRIDGELYAFCCSSCAARFAERYERLDDGAGD
jgi:DNA-binding Lrp family transcriptional regulator